MIVPLGDNAFVNVAQICLLSGIQPAPKRDGIFQVRLLLNGQHVHVCIGSQDSMRVLHERIRTAMDQLGN